jgi:hypothetical protein
MSFAVMHRHMRSRSHVLEATKCIMQCSRSEECRLDILDRKIMPYLQEICRKWSRQPEILRSILRTFNWTANTRERLITLVDGGCVVTVLQCMKRHINDFRVVSPGIIERQMIIL